MNKRAALIVAGGKGLRMGADLPKQFMPIGGVPVLMRTLSAFYDHDNSIDIVLVLPREQMAFWQDLCSKHDFRIPHRIAEGGETRFHSVQNGLALIENDALVAVHDGVRPFVSSEVIETCYRAAETHGAVIPVTEVVETLRHVTDTDTTKESRTVPRSEYRLVQTPQTFQARLLKSAYAQPYTDAFTDDASVVEAVGHPITLVQGNKENIKLTTPFDLTVAEALLKRE